MICDNYNENDLLYFDNDKEFIDFCMNGSPTVYHDDTINADYYDYDFTDLYNNAITNNKYFVITDPLSLVTKNKLAFRGLISKPVQNVCQPVWNKKTNEIDYLV